MRSCYAKMEAGWIPGHPLAFQKNAVGKIQYYDVVVEAVESVADTVVDAVDWVVDEVVAPVVETVGEVIQNAIDNPVKTVAQIAAIATQQYWALPLIEGADVAAKGGDLEDVAKAVAISIIAQEAGARVGSAVGSSTTNAATAANYGTTAASQQTAMLAAQEAGMQTAAQIAGNIAGSAAGSTAVAVVTGQDPVKAMIAGGVNAAVPAVLGQVDGFRDLTPTTQKIIETAVKTQLAGGDVGAAVIRSAIVSSQIAADTIKKLDPNNTLSRGQQAILADVVTAASVSAFTNGNVSAAVQKEIFNAGAKALGDMAKGKFKELSDGTQKAADRMTEVAQKITDNEAKQNEAVREYKVVQDQLTTRIEKQNQLKSEMDLAVDNANTWVKKYNAGESVSKTSVEEFIKTANSKVEAYNNYVSSLNSDYQNVFKPSLDKWQNELESLKIPHDQLVTDFTKEQQNLQNLASQLGQEVEVLENGVKKAFVGVMDTNFNPNEYRQINKLDASVDPYDHWLSKGQYERLPTNYKAAESAVMDEQARLLIEALGARDLKLTNLTKEDRERFYDTIEKQFGNDFTALKNANIADFDIDDILRTSSSLTINEEMVKDTYNADNRPSVSTYTAPDGYKLANQDEIFGNKAVLMPTSNGAFAWLTPDTASRDGYFWDPETGNQVLRITITGVGDPLKVETHGVGSTMEELRDSDPLGWFEMYKDFAPEDRQKTDLGDIVYNYIKDAYDKFAGSLDPATKEAIAKFAAAAKPESTTLDLMSGIVNGIKGITDAFGADNSVSKALGNARGYIQSLYSAQALDDKALMSRILDEAKDKGVLDQVIAGMEAIAAYPGVIVEAAGTIVPSLATAMATTVLGAPVVAARLAQLGVGAVSGAGIIKGTIYEETKKALIAKGVDPGTAEIKAQQAQAYNGKNLDSIIYGAVLGTAAAGTGVEKALTKEIASNIAEGVAAKEIAKQFVVGGLKEGIPEAAQGGQEKLAENIALQREGFEVPTWRGVAAAGTLEGLAGAPIGGAADVSSNMRRYDLAYTTPRELEEQAASEGYTLKPQDYQRFTGARDEQPTLEAFRSYSDPLATLESEAREFLASQGYVTPTQEDVQKIVGQMLESEAQKQAITIADPNVFDIQEIKAAAAAEGYALTDDQARALARQANEAEATAAYRAEIDPLAVIESEAQEFFNTYGYRPEPDELTQFIASKPETEVKTSIGAYVDPRQVTSAEAQAFFDRYGYKPSTDELAQFTKQGKDIQQAAIEKQLESYVDPRMTSTEEVVQAYRSLGLDQPTQEDVIRFIGQRPEAETIEEVKQNVDRARYNALQQSIAQGQIQAQRNKVMGENLALLTGAAAPAVAADDAAKFKKPFITSTAAQEEFKGPLQEFMEEVKTSDYTIQPFMETQSPTTPQVQENMQQGESMPSYFTYGQPADLDQLFSPFGTAGTSFFGMEPMLAKRGGLATPLMAGGGMTRYGRYAGGGLPMVAHSGKARVDFRQGDAVTGPGDGQSDDIPAMLADGEFVIPADVVAALGNGSTKAGSDKLYDMMHSIRAQHRSASPKDLPPPAKASPLDYLKGKKSARKARR